MKWFENPLRNNDFATRKWRRQKLGIPIAWCNHSGTRLTNWPSAFAGSAGLTLATRHAASAA